MKQNHRRRSIRLPHYDYSETGAYFITIVAHGRECLFGRIQSGEMHLNASCRNVGDVWNSLPARYPQIGVGVASVMPDHFHGIINIHASASRPVRADHDLPLRDGRDLQMERRRMTLPLVVGYFKMNTAKRINLLRGLEGVPVWQRNYYERDIRDEEEYNRVHQYIEANVSYWESIAAKGYDFSEK